MKNIKKQYLIIFIPFMGFVIISFLIMFKYTKYLRFINAWFYTLFPTVLYFGLIGTIIREIYLFFPGNELIEITLLNLLLLIVGFLMIITQRYILKKHGFE